MNKKLIRLTESDLHRIVKESVNRILSEVNDSPDNITFDDDVLDRHVNPYRAGKMGNYYARTGEVYLTKGDGPYDRIDVDSEKKDASDREKRIQDLRDKRWMKSANSRPLNRKGSLNRAFDN